MKVQKFYNNPQNLYGIPTHPVPALVLPTNKNFEGRTTDRLEVPSLEDMGCFFVRGQKPTLNIYLQLLSNLVCRWLSIYLGSSHQLILHCMWYTHLLSGFPFPGFIKLHNFLSVSCVLPGCFPSGCQTSQLPIRGSWQLTLKPQW